MHLNAQSSTIYHSQDMEPSNCSLTDEWINKIRGIDTNDYNSTINKNEITPSAAMWVEIIIQRGVSQKDKYDITYMWNRSDTNDLIYKTETDP